MNPEYIAGALTAVVATLTFMLKVVSGPSRDARILKEILELRSLSPEVDYPAYDTLKGVYATRYALNRLENTNTWVFWGWVSSIISIVVYYATSVYVISTTDGNFITYALIGFGGVFLGTLGVLGYKKLRNHLSPPFSNIHPEKALAQFYKKDELEFQREIEMQQEVYHEGTSTPTIGHFRIVALKTNDGRLAFYKWQSSGSAHHKGYNHEIQYHYMTTRPYLPIEKYWDKKLRSKKLLNKDMILYVLSGRGESLSTREYIVLTPGQYEEITLNWRVASGKLSREEIFNGYRKIYTGDL